MVLLVVLTPNIEGVWFVLPNRVEPPKVEGWAVVPLAVAGFPNKLPPKPVVACWFCGCPRVPPPNNVPA